MESTFLTKAQIRCWWNFLLPILSSPIENPGTPKTSPHLPGQRWCPHVGTIHGRKFPYYDVYTSDKHHLVEMIIEDIHISLTDYLSSAINLRGQSVLLLFFWLEINRLSYWNITSSFFLFELIGMLLLIHSYFRIDRPLYVNRAFPSNWDELLLLSQSFKGGLTRSWR